MENDMVKTNGQEINLSVEILTPIVSTRLNNGDLISSFVGKKKDHFSGNNLVVGEVYAVMAWNAMAELLRAKYKKGMLLSLQGILSYVSMKFGHKQIPRKTLVVTKIIQQNTGI